MVLVMSEWFRVVADENKIMDPGAQMPYGTRPPTLLPEIYWKLCDDAGFADSIPLAGQQEPDPSTPWFWRIEVGDLEQLDHGQVRFDFDYVFYFKDKDVATLFKLANS